MVHGLVGPLHFFEPARLLPGIEVFTPDLLGYAQQDAPQHVSLATQADFIADLLRNMDGRPCHLLGHSVGAAIAFLAAARVPELVQSIVCVEGNFTLEDAFMCRRIASLDGAEWEQELLKIQNSPATWLAKNEIDITPERLKNAEKILHNQSATILQSMAHAVVSETSAASYLSIVRKVLDDGISLHLLSGSKSTKDWHVPLWVRKLAATDVIVPESGHMMMLENPSIFCHLLSEILY